MDYNTQLPHLIISEHGRNIQKMVDYACTVADKEQRNKVALTIIDIIGQLNPQLRDVPDFKHKLWDHLFIMSDFKLDVDSPYPKPSRDILTSKPDRVNYPANNIKYKHYGKNVEHLLAKAIETENPEHRKEFTEVMANLMKKNYLNWNKDTVEDELILRQMKQMSNDQLIVDANFTLTSTQELLSTGKVNNANANPLVSTSVNLKKKNKNNFRHKKFK